MRYNQRAILFLKCTERHQEPYPSNNSEEWFWARPHHQKLRDATTYALSFPCDIRTDVKNCLHVFPNPTFALSWSHCVLSDTDSAVRAYEWPWILKGGLQLHSCSLRSVGRQNTYLPPHPRPRIFAKTKDWLWHKVSYVIVSSVLYQIIGWFLIQVFLVCSFFTWLLRFDGASQEHICKIPGGLHFPCVNNY